MHRLSSKVAGAAIAANSNGCTPVYFEVPLPVGYPEVVRARMQLLLPLNHAGKRFFLRALFTNQSLSSINVNNAASVPTTDPVLVQMPPVLEGTTDSLW